MGGYIVRRLLATLVLGVVFIAGQLNAWRQLTVEGAPFHASNNSTACNSA